MAEMTDREKWLSAENDIADLIADLQQTRAALTVLAEKLAETQSFINQARTPTPLVRFDESDTPEFWVAAALAAAQEAAS